MNFPFFIKSITAVLLLLLISSYSTAQDPHTSDKDFSMNNQIKMEVAPVIYENLKIISFGTAHLKSRPCASFEANLSYCQHLNNRFGLNVGIGYTIAPFNTNYIFKSPPNCIFSDSFNIEELDWNMNDYMQSIIEFPLSLQKTIPMKKNNTFFYSLEAGIKLNILFAFPYSIQQGSYYMTSDTTDLQLYDMTISNTLNRYMVSGFLKFGILNLTKKQNTLQCNLVINYSPMKSGLGSFTFNHLNYESYGTVKQRINYIGISFNYGITLNKRTKQHLSPKIQTVGKLPNNAV